MIRVLVADGYEIVRLGLRALINAQPDMRVVGEAADGPAAVALAAELNPDVVVEVCLAGMGGPQVAAKLREARPGARVLVLTACEEAESLRRLLEAGAAGCVLKRASAEQLVQAIRAVAAGGTFVDPAVAGRVVQNFVGAPGHENGSPELSEREAEVVRMIALGYSNKEIAARLRLSVKTVETYKTRSMDKLGMQSRVDIVRFAIRRGWLTDAEPAAGAAPALQPAYGSD